MTAGAQHRLHGVPYLLIAIRFVAGLGMLALAATLGAAAGWLCVVLLAVGVLSDIFDGVIARRIGSVTDRLRTWDSRTDLVFWLCVTAALIVIHPSLWKSTWPIVVVLGTMEATTHSVSFVRFRREASPHHLLSKLFALSLWALVSVLFVTGEAPWLQGPVFLLGVASQAEALVIMLLLPQWRADVRSWREALRLRRAAQAILAEPQNR